MAPDYLTNINPPPVDASKSAIENSLELTALSHIGPDVYTNTRPLWRPPGARGIYGGAVIAHCLVAGQFTIPSHFTVHSMHCYFVLAGDSEIPVIYHVDRVREGKSFATRTVQAKQRGRCIFTTTISFTHDNSETAVITHTIPLPEGLKPPPNDDKIVEMVRANQGRPFLSDRFKASNLESNNPHERKARQWIKTAGKINPGADYKTHISALAYMSDSYFIGSVPMIHGVLRHWPNPEELSSQLSSDAESSKKNKRAGVVSMLVSLDHTIYFHQARGFRADEWIFAEVSSPWSGNERAVVMQHMFARDGTLIATCFQEGVVRMQQEKPMRPQL